MKTSVPTLATSEVDNDDDVSSAANDNSGETSRRQTLAIAWLTETAPLELARTLGEIAADLWLADKLVIDRMVLCGHNRPHDDSEASDQERSGQAESDDS